MSDIAILLFNTQGHQSGKFKSIPVVKSEESQILLFSVEVQSLRKYLFEYYHSISHMIKGEAKETLNKYFYKINTISNNDLIDKTTDNIVDYLTHIGEHPAQKMNVEVVRDSDGLRVAEFNEANQSRPFENQLEHDEAEEFWKTPINWESHHIQSDKAPFTLLLDTPLAKIHFLFTMLNISQLFVIDEGVLVGIITKHEFLRRRTHDNAQAQDFQLPNTYKQDFKHEEFKDQDEHHDEYIFQGRQLRKVADGRTSI